MSSSLFIGFSFSETKMSNADILKIHKLTISPLILMNSILPKQIVVYQRANNTFGETKPKDFFSQLFISQYLTKIYVFNTSAFS